MDPPLLLLLQPHHNVYIVSKTPQSSARRPQEVSDGGEGLPKRGPRGSQEVPTDVSNNTKMMSEAEIAKTSKMVTLSMKINDFRNRKVADIIQKQAQKGEN